MSSKRLISFSALLLGLASLVGSPLALAATAADSGLSLEISPAPIILTIKPGESQTTQFKIYNGGTATENLKIDLQSFRADQASAKITLQPGQPVEVADWVRFSQPKFSLKPGERLTEDVTIDLPATAGFSYGFAMIISRQSAPTASTGQTAIEGSVAVFTLLNVDRPGAVKSLQIASVKSSRHVYEYLPAELTLKLKNNGNSLLLPAGNVYIARTSTSDNPISVLPINPNGLYLLPGVSREYPVRWNDGVPVYVSEQAAANATPGRHLEWHWRDSTFRIGKYVARVVVIYDNGQRDVPLETEVSFWVFPWKIVLGLVFAGLILLIGLVAILKFMVRQGRRYQHGRRKHTD